VKLHPQVQALVDAAGDEPDPADLAAMRAGYLETALELGGALEPVAEVRDLVIPRPADGGSIPAQAFWPQHAQPRALVLWHHGGGWCYGDLPGIERVARALANASGAIVVAVGYRLAPEDPYPAAADDAEAALRWAAGAPYGPLPVVIGGDSAGGNIATVAARRAPGVAALQVLVYPACDAAMDTPSYTEFDDHRLLAREAMVACWRTYGGDPAEPDVSPLRADDLGAMPPTLVITAECDVLRDEGEDYAARLRDAGVDVELHRFEGMVHGFLRWGGVVDDAREAISLIGDAVRARVPAPS
jgi:acetyl esterase